MLATLKRRLWFTLSYWLPGKPPWDSGISPPELVRVVEGAGGNAPLPAGRSLDLGCGTGTNVLYLAAHGWHATGVDFAGKAIAKAQAKARQAPPAVAARASFHVGDVTRLGFLQPPFDLALDMGCLHSLVPQGQARYAAGLARLMRPGGLYLLYAFKPEAGAASGLSEEAVARLFSPAFVVVEIEQGQGRPSAWYTLRKT
jgi:SAM-dependent methyltransferase